MKFQQKLKKLVMLFKKMRPLLKRKRESTMPGFGLHYAAVLTLGIFE